MKLLEPYFLYAFLALAIPILIHLFSLQRHKTVYFSNVAFLRQLQQKKSNITKLQKLLLLALRLLLLAALILAFCEPYMSDNEALSKDKKIVGIYLDNSFSMGANNDKGLLIEQAKNHARSVLNAHKGKDEYIFISNELQGKHQRILDYNDCLEAIDQTQIVPSGLSLNSVISRFTSLKQNEVKSSEELYLISDFQKTTSPNNFVEQNKKISTHLLPLNSYPQTNLSIDTCFFETPNHNIGQQEWLLFEVSNTSNEPIENLSVKLYINGEQKALTSINIPSNSKATAKLGFNNQKSGNQKAYLELSDATITFDNKLYFNFDVQNSTKILSIYETQKNISLSSLFSDPIFEFKSIEIGKIDLAELKDYNLIILDNLSTPSTGLSNSLNTYSKEGGTILLFPSADINFEAFNSFSQVLSIPKFSKQNTKKVKVSDINKNHLVFKDVFEEEYKKSNYPEVNFYYSLDNSYHSSEESILSLNTKEALLNSYKNERGTIFVNCSPLNSKYTTFEKHALFVPLLYNIANLNNKEKQIYFTLGQDRVIQLNEGSMSADWRISKGIEKEFIPEVRAVNQQVQLNLQNNLQEDGFYNLSNGEINKTLSFNFDRKESNLVTWEIEELEELSEDFTHINIWDKEGLQLENALKENRSGTPLWRYYILLALLFILAESLLIKNWNKKAQINLEN